MGCIKEQFRPLSQPTHKPSTALELVSKTAQKTKVQRPSTTEPLARRLLERDPRYHRGVVDTGSPWFTLGFAVGVHSGGSLAEVLGFMGVHTWVRVGVHGGSRGFTRHAPLDHIGAQPLWDAVQLVARVADVVNPPRPSYRPSVHVRRGGCLAWTHTPLPRRSDP